MINFSSVRRQAGDGGRSGRGSCVLDGGDWSVAGGLRGAVTCTRKPYGYRGGSPTFWSRVMREGFGWEHSCVPNSGTNGYRGGMAGGRVGEGNEKRTPHPGGGSGKARWRLCFEDRKTDRFVQLRRKEGSRRGPPMAGTCGFSRALFLSVPSQPFLPQPYKENKLFPTACVRQSWDLNPKPS